MFDKDYFEVLHLTQEDKNKALELQIAQMRREYSHSVMIDILDKSYAQISNLSHVVYSTKHAYIFRPSIDKELVENVFDSISSQDTLPQVFLFPILKQPIKTTNVVAKMISSFLAKNSPSYNHWVTLHYDTKTQIATLIDPLSNVNSSESSYENLKSSLLEGLKNLRLSIKEFRVIQQEFKIDFCGPWTAINIELLAYDAPISCLSNIFKSADFNSIVQHHINKVFYKKEDLLRYDCINLDLIDELKITPPDILKISQSVLYDTNPTSIVESINERENILYEGKYINKKNPLLWCNIKDVLVDLTRKYRIEVLQVIESKSTQEGYSLRDPDRLLNNLRNIGLNVEEIKCLSLPQILFYDLVVFMAMSLIDMQIQEKKIIPITTKRAFFNDESELKVNTYLNDQKNEIRKKTLSILKKLICEHYQLRMSIQLMQRLPIKSLMLSIPHRLQNPKNPDNLSLINNQSKDILRNFLYPTGQSHSVLDIIKLLGLKSSNSEMTTNVYSCVERKEKKPCLLLEDVLEITPELNPSELNPSELNPSELNPSELSPAVTSALNPAVTSALKPAVTPEPGSKFFYKSSNGSKKYHYCCYLMMIIYEFFRQILETISDCITSAYQNVAKSF
jgi:hypothetical protein